MLVVLEFVMVGLKLYQVGEQLFLETILILGVMDKQIHWWIIFVQGHLTQLLLLMQMVVK